MLPRHATQELQQKPVPSKHKETPGNTQATATAQYTHSTLLKSSNRPMAAARRRQGQQLYAWHGTPSRRPQAAPPFPLTLAGEGIHACALCGCMHACACVLCVARVRAHVCMCGCVCASACAYLRVHARVRVCVRGRAHACQGTCVSTRGRSYASCACACAFSRGCARAYVYVPS